VREILLATSNPGKCAEVKRIIQESGLSLSVLSLADLKIAEQASETGSSFVENASAKALFYARFYPGPVLAEDSGLEVAALSNAPGIYSARYSGEMATPEKNIELLLSNLKGVENRRARFVSYFALAKGGRLLKCFCGQVEGEITHFPDGANGFGYDPVFYYPPAGKTFARMTPQEKNSISHRRLALEQVVEFLRKEEKLWI